MIEWLEIKQQIKGLRSLAASMRLEGWAHSAAEIDAAIDRIEALSARSMTHTIKAGG